ncbi:MAG: hypothetical protein IPN59_00870 [Holophaga sp.]|nr:hypothetical protein [Holophaga sp.]
MRLFFTSFSGISAGLALLLLLACGGGGETGNSAGPTRPVITAPASVTAGQTGILASVENQEGCHFTWSVSGATITGGADTRAITLTAGSVGSLTLSCTASKNGISATSNVVTIQVLSGTWETPLSASSLPSLQINISAEGSRQWIFANMLRTSEAWISVPGATPAQAQALASQVQVDASGWPTSFPAGAEMRMFAGYETGPGTYLHGAYVLTWQGAGNVELQSSENNGVNEELLLNDQAHGRIVKLIKTPTKAVIVFVHSSDVSNPVRNMRLWAPATDGAGLSLTSGSDLSAGKVTGSLEPKPGEAEPMWHPRFLQHLAEAPNYGVLRFMGWLAINQNTWGKDPLEWSDRGDSSYSFAAFNTVDATYNRYPVAAYRQRLGMPYEWMIDLCNAVGKDLWIQVPHVASEELIRKLADLCATRLNPGLRVWFEYSNEIWNGIDPYLAQQNKARAVAAAHFGVAATALTNAQFAWGSGHLQGLALKTFEDEWRTKGMPDSRLINVAAGFAQGSAYNQGVLDAMKEIDPTLPEVLAITNYFGYGTQGDIFALHTFGTTPGVWPAEIYEKTKEIVRRNLYETTGAWKANADVARGAGVPLVAYEGGQHMLAMGYGDWNNPAHADFMYYLYDFQRSVQIEELYREHYALWNAMGGRTASLFVDTGGWSFWGYWGAKEYMVQTPIQSRKWNAFKQWGDLQAGVRAPSEPLQSRPVLPELALKAEAKSSCSLDTTAVGGDGSVQMAIVGGSLAPGLTFTQIASGVARIAGTPTVDGVYRFVVRALDGDKDPDFKAYTLAIDPQGVQSNAMVVFRGENIPGTVPNNGWITRFNPARAYIQVNTSGVLTRQYIPFSLTQALFDKEVLEVVGTPKVLPATSPENMYGGWSTTSLPGGTKTPEVGGFIGLRNHEWQCWTGDNAGGPSAFDALLMWRSDQFNPMGGSGTYRFGSDAATSLLRLDMTSLIADGDNEIRFVVLNHDASGNTFYLSEAAHTSPYLGDGYFQLSGFTGSSTPGLRWAAFTPTADAFSLPDAATLAFAARTFSDIRAVGFAYHGRRWGYYYAFNFARFLVLGTRN